MKQPEKVCVACKGTFTKKPKESKTQWEKKKLCSIKCRGKYLASLKDRNKKISESQKGSSNSFWKGGENKCPVCNKKVGYRATYCKKHMTPNNWKGKDAKYSTIHHWVRYHKGTPQECEHCGTTEDRMYHWANKCGKYTRDLDDWIRLCVPCHSKYDKRSSKN